MIIWATQGVILTIQQHNQSDIWLADESQTECVRAELARFMENPGDPRYLAASWQSGQTNSGCITAVFLFSPRCVKEPVPLPGW
nr:GlpG protein (membrane protein of glp regulon) [Salmonella sp. NCTC 7297]